MIYIDRFRCDGCGICLDVCPEGAISLMDGRAFIEDSICKECAACQSACPQNAIIFAEVIEPAEEEVTLLHNPQSTHTTTTQPRSLVPSSRDWVLPAIGSALLWTGREIIPRLVSLALDSFDRRIQTADQVPSTLPPQPQKWVRPGCGAGQRRHLRRRRRKSF